MYSSTEAEIINIIFNRQGRTNKVSTTVGQTHNQTWNLLCYPIYEIHQKVPILFAHFECIFLKRYNHKKPRGKAECLRIGDERPI